MARKLSEEDRHARQRAGLRRWQRLVDQRIDEIFAMFDAESEPNAGDPAPSEFAARYYQQYGRRLPLLYARAKTEFGERYGRKMNFEECRLGVFAPLDQPDISEQLRRAESAQAIADAYFKSHPEADVSSSKPSEELIPDAFDTDEQF